MAVLIVLVLVAIGLPVLSGGRGGLAVFAGPTAGFLVGWLFAAFVTGYLTERLVRAEQTGLVQTVGFFLASLIGGIVVLYAVRHRLIWPSPPASAFGKAFSVR